MRCRCVRSRGPGRPSSSPRSSSSTPSGRAPRRAPRTTSCACGSRPGRAVGPDLGVAALWLFTAAAGGACAGLILVPLRIEERGALAIVIGVVGGSLITLLISLFAGLTALTALLGPAIL